MFIAINARADVPGSKKGKLTPTQNAVVNAFSLEKQTGIFDLSGKCEPYLTRIDGNTATVYFHHGFLSICGRIVECEEGSTVDITLPASATSGRIIAKFDLSSVGTEEFTVFAENSSRPLETDDLLDDSGVYELRLWGYNATSNSVEFNFGTPPPIIKTIKGLADELKRDINNGSIDAGTANVARNYNQRMGTIKEKFDEIEGRLTALGFKQGSVSGLADATLTKQGNYAILKIPSFVFSGSGFVDYTMSFTSAETFDAYVSTNTASRATLKFTAGSNILKIGAPLNAVVDNVRVGFEIAGY